VEFGAPAFLWGLPLAGLPVVFHLLMKRRRKHVKFPSLLFLREADPHLDMKRKLREFLLLAARVLLILLLVLTLSRPSFENVPGLGREVDVVIMVDNSGSMSAAAGEKNTKLEVAKQGARSLVDSLKSGSRAAVLPLVPEPGDDETPAFHTDPEKAKDRIDRVRRTEATGMTGAFFDRVRRIAEGMASGSGKALHVFTDLHKATWDRKAGAVKNLPEDLNVVFNQISTPKRGGTNVSVESMRPPGGTVLPGHEHRAGAVLQNTGARNANVRVRYRDSTGSKTGRRVQVPTDASRVVRFPFTPEEAGVHWYIVTVEGDGFRGDNRGAAPVFCQTEGRVVLAGDQSVYGTIPAAVSPTGTGRYTSLVPVTRSLENGVRDGDEPVPLLVVANWRHLTGLSGDAVTKLQKYLQNGGTMLVVPDSSRGVEDEIGEGPDWMEARAGSPIKPEEPRVARILNPESAEWIRLWEAGTPLPLQFFLVNRFVPLQLSEAFTGLAGPAGKRPLLATRTIGDGRLYVSGVALDRDWTPLVTDPSGLIVVMLHRMATRGGSMAEGPEFQFTTAGEPVTGPGGDADQLQVRSLVGDAVDATLTETNRPVFPRAGAFQITAGNRRIFVSVTGAAEEATEQFVPSDRVPVMGNREHSVVNVKGGDDISDQLQRHLVGLSLFLPLALLTLLIWVLESWLATMLKKRSRAVESERGEQLGGG